MGDGSGALIMLVAGLLIFRPKDVPSLARNTGRLAGMALRSIKRAREVADESIQRGTSNSALSSNPTMQAMRSTFESSVSQLSSISTTLQREMSDVPISPASYIRSRVRQAALNQSKKNQNSSISKTIENSKPQRQQEPTTLENQSDGTPPLSSVTSHNAANNSFSSKMPPPSIGVDFIAKGIEEDALKRQKDKIFGEGRNAPSST